MHVLVLPSGCAAEHFLLADTSVLPENGWGWGVFSLVLGLAFGLAFGAGSRFRATLRGVKRGSRREVMPVQVDPDRPVGLLRRMVSPRPLGERRLAEQRLREQEQQYRSVFESTTDAMMIFDLEGRLIEVNPACCAMHGYGHDELIGRHGTHLIHPNDHAKFPKFLEAVSAGEPFQVSGTHVCKDGTSIAVEVVGSSFVFAGQPALLAVVRNVTEEKQALAALRDSEALLRYTLGATQVGQWDLDLQTGIAERNLRHDQIFGYRELLPEWNYDRFLNQHVHPDDRASVDRLFRQALSANQEWEFECRIVRADHAQRWIWAKGSVYRSEAGTPLRMAGLVIDITERKKAERALKESEERFRDLADNISQFAWMADAKGWVFWFNRRWFEYTGTTLKQMQGWGWRQVHHPDHVDRVVERIQYSWDTGEPWEDTFPLRGKDGQYRWFLSRALPIRDARGNIVRWFGTNTDITEQRQLQEDLRRLAAQLSEADRRKDEFLATLAHELRNPLAPIRTGLEVLRLGENDPDTVEEIRATMERQTQQLIALVDDLLDISRITRGKLELHRCRVDLTEVIQSAVEAARPHIDQANHELTVVLPEPPIEIDADPHRLAQVLSNLLVNAAKYTPDGGQIALAAERRGQEACVSVKDSGIGIPAEMLEGVFEMFTQVDRSIERGDAGLGIGLTLVKSLMEMHGGEVTVRSEGENRGSEFTVRMPIPGEEASELGPGGRTNSAESGRRIQRRVLVVDDNRPAADMLAMVIKMLGNEVRTAHDGQEAIERASEFRPDVVLMDLGMPRMNGYEAARHIRGQTWGRSMMLVALTGWGQETDKRRTEQAGFDRHLVKPAEPAVLQQLLAAAPQNRS